MTTTTPDVLAPLRRLVRAVRERMEARRLAGRPVDDVFDEIYRRNHWGSSESLSGTGSDQRQTARIVAELPGLLRRHGVESMLDVPCGDFNWMSRVDLAGVDYTGGDIVADLVESNNERYAGAGVRFRRLDLLSDPLPQVDLVFCRDCLVHFSLADVRRALANVASSGAKFLLTTTFPAHPRNRSLAGTRPRIAPVQPRAAAGNAQRRLHGGWRHPQRQVAWPLDHGADSCGLAG
jgi:hypothetical protein